MKKSLFGALLLLSAWTVSAADFFRMDGNAFKMTTVSKINGAKTIVMFNGLFPNSSSTILKLGENEATENAYVHEIDYDPTLEDNLNQALAMILNAQNSGQQLIFYGTVSGGVLSATKVFSKSN